MCVSVCVCVRERERERVRVVSEKNDGGVYRNSEMERKPNEQLTIYEIYK